MIEKVSAISGVEFFGAAPVNQISDAAGFTALLENAVIDGNDKILRSEQMLLDVSSGQAVDTHDVMLASEHAKLQLSLISEVRNKLTEGYQELMRMQI